MNEIRLKTNYNKYQDIIAMINNTETFNYTNLLFPSGVGVVEGWVVGPNNSSQRSACH